MISEDSKSSLRRLMEARTAWDEAKHAKDVAEKDFREKETEVFEALDEDGIKGSIKVDLGEPWGVVAFRNRETVWGRIIDDDAAYDYFETRGMADEISKPHFVKKRVNEIVRELREQGLELPPGVDFYTQTGVTITRQKG